MLVAGYAAFYLTIPFAVFLSQVSQDLSNMLLQLTQDILLPEAQKSQVQKPSGVTADFNEIGSFTSLKAISYMQNRMDCRKSYVLQILVKIGKISCEVIGACSASPRAGKGTTIPIVPLALRGALEKYGCALKHVFSHTFFGLTLLHLKNVYTYMYTTKISISSDVVENVC